VSAPAGSGKVNSLVVTGIFFATSFFSPFRPTLTVRMPLAYSAVRPDDQVSGSAAVSSSLTGV
jgi:hypothetical protein